MSKAYLTFGKTFVALFGATVFVLTGCSIGENVQVFHVTDEDSLVQYPQWKNVENGLDYKELAVRDENDSIREVLEIFRIDKQKYFFDIAINTASPKKVSEWDQVIESPLIINGPYFNELFEPTAYLKTKTEEFGAKIYDGSNGYTGAYVSNEMESDLVFLKDQVINSQDFATVVSTYPTIIRPGSQPGIPSDTKQIASRTVMAQDLEDNFYVIISPRNVLSLHELMEILMKSDLNIDIAINLDGGPSTGYSLDTKELVKERDTEKLPAVFYLRKI